MIFGTQTETGITKVVRNQLNFQIKDAKLAISSLKAHCGLAPIIVRCGILLSLSLQLCPIHSFLTDGDVDG